MAGRYDRVNGAWTKVQKRYDKINGAWTPVKKRYDKDDGVWMPSFCGGIRWHWSVGGYYPSASYWDSAEAADSSALHAKSSLAAPDEKGVSITYTFDEPILLNSGLGPNNANSIELNVALNSSSPITGYDQAYGYVDVNGERNINAILDMYTGVGRFSPTSDTLVSSITFRVLFRSFLRGASIDVNLYALLNCQNWQKTFYLNNSGEYDG